MSNMSALLPELQLLWVESTGDPRVCVAVLDGPVDQSHPSLQDAQLTQLPTLVTDAAGTGHMSGHGTHITSVIFGQHGSPVQGIAPRCRGLIAPVFSDDRHRSLSQIDLARAINQAVEQGANVISISGGELTGSGEADPILEKAVQFCNDSGVLIVAAAGNDACDCLHVPAALPSVLAVGAMNAEGVPLDYSNWGKGYQSQGILAPGENILGARPGGGEMLQSGTSFATPIVAGLVALLLSIQLKRGEKMDPHLVRRAILQSALPCPPDAVGEDHRCLAGRLNVSGTYTLITKGERQEMSEQNSPVEGIQPNEASHGGEAAVTTPPQAAPMYPVAYVDPSSGMMVVPSAQGAPVAPAQMGVVQMPANYYVPVNYAPVNYGTPHHVVPAAVPGQAGGVQQAPVSYGTPMMATPHHVAPAAAPGQVPGHNGGVQQVPVSYVTPTAATPQNVVQYASPSGQISEGTPAPNQTATAAVTPSDVRASGDCGCGTATGPLVYAIGTLGYDLMTEARRDSFKQAMPLVDSANIHNTEQHPSADWTPDYTVVMVPGNPFDVRQLTNYLLGPPDLITGNGILTLGEEADDYAVVRIEGADNMYEAHSLIWTLNLELTPIYAIEPVGPYASQVYKQLALFLEGQSLPNTENDQGEIIYETGIIDKISIPGILTGKTVQLFSGQVVPVIQISSPRGLYGWRTSVLIDTVITTVTEGLELESADLETLQYKLRFSLESFLERIYYDLRNLGQTSHDRAFNYAAVNAFQLADILAKVLQIEDEANTTTTTMQLDTIQVVRSPFCRIDSDCWDVKLKFFNPENDQQAKKVLRYTIDVSDVMPVTLGQPRIWNEV